MPQISTICVYCASSTQLDDRYVKDAETLGKLLAVKDITCVNGAGKMGLMGAVSNSVLENGGAVVGVIPQFMVDNGWFHPSLTKIHVTQNMHERKQLMAELADAFIALPGGIGTLEELIEVITWKQLGLHRKPVVILNTNHIYDPLLEQLELMAQERFMRDLHTELYQVAENPEEALSLIENAMEWPSDYDKFAAL